MVEASPLAVEDIVGGEGMDRTSTLGGRDWGYTPRIPSEKHVSFWVRVSLETLFFLRIIFFMFKVNAFSNFKCDNTVFNRSDNVTLTVTAPKCHLVP